MNSTADVYTSKELGDSLKIEKKEGMISRSPVSGVKTNSGIKRLQMGVWYTSESVSRDAYEG
jgi:hypothetical protein